jgi:hypothetical protein
MFLCAQAALCCAGLCCAALCVSGPRLLTVRLFDIQYLSLAINAVAATGTFCFYVLFLLVLLLSSFACPGDPSSSPFPSFSYAPSYGC